MKKTPSLGKSLIRIYSLKWVGWGWGLSWVWVGGGGGGRLFEAGRLLTFSAFRMSAYSRWVLIRGWALIRINMVINWSGYPLKVGKSPLHHDQCFTRLFIRMWTFNIITRDRHKNGSYAFALYLKGWHQGDWHLQIIISKASFKINNLDPSTVFSTFNIDK